MPINFPFQWVKRPMLLEIVYLSKYFKLYSSFSFCLNIMKLCNWSWHRIYFISMNWYRYCKNKLSWKQKIINLQMVLQLNFSCSFERKNHCFIDESIKYSCETNEFTDRYQNPVNWIPWHLYQKIRPAFLWKGKTGV